MLHVARLLLLLAAAWAGAALGGAAHELTLRIAPETGLISGVDHVTVTAPAAAVRLELAPGLEVQRVSSAAAPLAFTRRGSALEVQLPRAAAAFDVQYAGRFGPDAAAQVTPAASWLPGESLWFPRQSDDDQLVVTIVTPSGQRAALTGELLREQLGREENRATFKAYPAQPPTLFAGPYVVDERMHGGLRLRTYFPASARELAPAYLDDVARHIDFFTTLIGPYPYRGFAVIAAEEGVGFGYPGATYVSRRILALPFMRGQSLAHEILHDWWGNAVPVAPGSGNWAEGLTTYMADYRLSADSERAKMRREWLRDYAALPAAQDQPLRAFASRVHTRDLVVGYGKGASVFSMLEQVIGPQAFNRGAASFYERWRGRSAGWRELQQAFERTSGRDLTRFFHQWVDAAGAPSLSLDDVRFEPSSVRFALAQSQPPYALQVPVAIRTEVGVERHVVALDQPRQAFELRAAARPLQVMIDPDQQIFRRLVAGEATPIVRDVTIRPGVQVVAVNVAADAQETAHELADALLSSPQWLAAASERVPSRPAAVFAIGTPQQMAQRLGIAPPALPANDGTAWVWAQAANNVPTLFVCAATPQALQALLRPLPHYGREGWLVFRDAKLAARGNWPVPASNALSAQAP